MYLIVSIKRLTIPGGMSVVDSTDLSGKELRRQVGLVMVVTAGSLYGEMVSTLPWNARDVGSIPALDTIFLFSSHPQRMSL